MRRVPFSLRGKPVWSYLTLLYLGLVCGFYVMYAIAPTLGMPRVAASLATLILFVPVLVGSRMWFVLEHWATYRHRLRRCWRPFDGGVTFYGGLILALAFSPLALKPFGLAFATFWDGEMLTILVGMIFVSVGCLPNERCSGRHNDGRIALWLPDQAGRWERRYPVQLLELGAALLLLAGAATLLVIGAPHGSIFVFSLVGYVVVRLALDSLREPPIPASAGHPVALATFLMLSVLAAGLGLLATT